jgi:ribulose kinase
LVGGAMCAAVALGAFSDFRRASAAFVKLGPTITPLTQNQELYTKTYERFVRLFTLLSQHRAFTP